MSRLFNKAKFIGTVLSVMLCIPLAVNAADSKTDSTGSSGNTKDYTYSTRGKGTTASSKSWEKRDDNTWVMDTNGDKVIDVVLKSTINNSTGNQEWEYTFYVEDNDRAYEVYEEMITGTALPLGTNYSSSGSDGKAAIPQEPGSTDNGDGTYNKNYTITNKKDHKGYGNLKITKTVSNPDNMQNKEQTFTFTVKLKAPSSSTPAQTGAVTGTKIYGDALFENGTATVSLKAGEAAEITGLPEGLTYTVTEDVPEGYNQTASEGTTGAIIKDSESSVSFTNESTYTPPTRTFTSFALTKSVEDPANISSETEYTFHVVFNGMEQYDYVTITKNEGEAEKSGQADENGFLSIDVSLKDGDKVVFGNIPATVVTTNTDGSTTEKSLGVTYQVSEDGGEYTPSYTITDASGKNLVAQLNGTGKQNESLSTSKETVDKGEDITIAYTNTIERLQNLKLVKKSVDANGNEDTTDTNRYNITATFSELTPGYKIMSTNGVLIADDDGIAETTFLVSPNDEITFEDIPVGTEYQFTEEKNDKVASYKITATGTSNIVAATGSNTEPQKDLETDVETVDALEEATVTFTNTTPPAANLIVEKYDSDEKTKLGGAEFALYRKDGTSVNFNVDGSNTIVIGSSGSSGELVSTLFTKGEYYLIETKAPEGHTISGDALSFEIKQSDLGKTITIKAYDDRLVVLPSTGGTGRTGIYIIAGTLAAAVIVLVILKARQRRYY